MTTRTSIRFSGVLSASLLLGSVFARPLEASWQGPSPQATVLAFLMNPNVVYLLLVVGLLALAAEFATGGTVLAGVTGAVCLILALIGLGQLPTNWAGAALMVAGVAMLLLDLHVSGFALSIGGVIAFVLGSLLLFTPPWAGSALGSGARLSLFLVLATSGGVAGFFLLALAAILQSRSAPVAVGRRTLIGKIGTVRESLAPQGIVHLEGEMWSAVAADRDPLPSGTAVRVVGIDGLLLRVEAVTHAGQAT